MLSVEEARERIISAMNLLPASEIGISEAFGRVLAADVTARRSQPPHAISAMDGYAVKAADIATLPIILKVVGYAPAGAAYNGTLQSGEAVRIFTGAPVPDGADTVIIQEDTDLDGDFVTIKDGAPGLHIRAAGLDFSEGDCLLSNGRIITARDAGLLAAMNRPWVKVRRKPRVAILSTGDEIVMPGDPVGPNQIVSANSIGLAAIVRLFGGEPILLGIAPDDRDGLANMAAGARGMDLLLTTGGASVGDHDLIQEVLGDIGLELDFWKIAMRPGKPLIFGNFDGTPMLGLPGNPVSSMVCAILFLRPAMQALLGIADQQTHMEEAILGAPLGQNGSREDYVRATMSQDENGARKVTPFPVQDSSMMVTLSQSDCFIVRPPNARPMTIDETVTILPMPAGLQSF
ncbi:MAG: molybdopterin molybdenumtransferase MoeA [Rhodospirillaceae bacterium]|nr:molybdopterin molybdenumtransferase MoeA [Rhodospirillaceae bacterium]|tara:strand:+ start:86 stop:1297 length:1212 start_codon:yes stop_codon:yes gene_type:complete